RVDDLARIPRPRRRAPRRRADGHPALPGRLAGLKHLYRVHMFHGIREPTAGVPRPRTMRLVPALVAVLIAAGCGGGGVVGGPAPHGWGAGGGWGGKALCPPATREEL